jgi:hypothetical protein
MDKKIIMHFCPSSELYYLYVTCTGWGLVVVVVCDDDGRRRKKNEERRMKNEE